MQKNEEVLQHATVGGSMDTALNGKYSLNGWQVLKHAAMLTTKNFMTFFPVVLLFFLVQILIAGLSLKIQIGDPSILIQAIAGEIPLTDNLFNAMQVANLTAEILSVPLYASVYLLAISNSIGLSTKLNIKNILVKGFQHTLPLTVTILMTSVAQFIGSYLFFAFGLYVTLIFSFAIPLVCEKRITPIKAMLYSAKAVNLKLFPIIQVYLVLGILLALTLMTWGFAFIWLMPFYFHVVAVLYRNIFGIQIVVSQVAPNSDNNQEGGVKTEKEKGSSSDTFDA